MQSISEIWLSVDLSSSQGTLALHRWSDEKVKPELIMEKPVGDTFHHSENFLPALDTLLKESGVELSQLSRLVTTSGPGSFTGLRIAFASLKAIAMVHGLPIETLSSSEVRAMAYASGKPAVVTQVASKRFSISKLPYDREDVIELADIMKTLVHGETVILDEKSDPVLFSAFQTVKFPLRAKYLGDFLFEASSRKTSSTLSEQIALFPNYFGNAKF